MSAARVLLALLATLLPGCEAGSARPTVVLVTPESLRADHVGSYGYHYLR